MRVQRDYALREQVVDGLSRLGNIGCEDVIEASVFADDDDDVLDRRLRVMIARLLGKSRREGELPQSQRA